MGPGIKKQYEMEYPVSEVFQEEPEDCARREDGWVYCIHCHAWWPPNSVHATRSAEEAHKLPIIVDDVGDVPTPEQMEKLRKWFDLVIPMPDDKNPRS